MGLIDVDYFMKMPLGLKGPKAYPEADILATYIETASTQVEKFCDRTFAQQQFTEELRGRDSYRLLLGQFPIASIDEVTWVDEGSLSMTGTIDIATYLRFETWGLVEFKYKGVEAFREGRIYTVKYTAGYDPIPGPVKHATALGVAQLLQPNYGGPSDSVPELVPQMTQLMVDLLDDYRRRTIRA